MGAGMEGLRPVRNRVRGAPGWTTTFGSHAIVFVAPCPQSAVLGTARPCPDAAYTQTQDCGRADLMETGPHHCGRPAKSLPCTSRSARRANAEHLEE